MEESDAEHAMMEQMAEELSDSYDVEESITERMERETEQALERIGWNAQQFEHKTLSQLSCGWRYKCRLIAAILTHPDCLIIDETSFLDASSTQWLQEWNSCSTLQRRTILSLF
mmetsp:Transcript_10663/g.19559  ORF Transcript_10663/g.19559 Transcript_10663/m.19559 type:complete len:114 (+) Transcript_10663:499-840(+)